MSCTDSALFTLAAGWAPVTVTCRTNVFVP